MIFDTLPVLRITDRLDSPNTGGNQDNTSISGVMTRVVVTAPDGTLLLGATVFGLAWFAVALKLASGLR